MVQYVYDMEKPLVGIALGIRHRRSFHIPEIVGAIIDDITSDEGSPFHKDLFYRTDPLTDGLETKGRLLIGNDDSSSLAIDIDSVVYDTKTDNLQTTVSQLKDTYIPYLMKNVFGKYKIENINRLGIVFTFLEKDTSKVDTLIGEFTNDTFVKPEHLELRFSEKDVAMASLVKKDILDYTNAIVTLQKRDNGVLSKFDYQFYYAPEIQSVNDVDFTAFLNAAQAEIKSRFFKWISPPAHAEK
jgi:hypothetical protein